MVSQVSLPLAGAIKAKLRR